MSDHIEYAAASKVDNSVGAAVKLSDVLSTEEIKPYLVRSDLRAGWMLLVNVVIFAVAFALPVMWLNPLTILASILLVGGRQLGLAVIYHDCSHGVFFKTRWLNEFVGHWVAGALLNTSMYAYRNYHLKHHRFAGTRDDPDLPLANSYPASRASLKRKFLRDATGRTGWKTITAQLKRVRPLRNAPFLSAHAVLIAVLWASGVLWTYALWWVAHAVVYQVILRLRFIAEHGVAIDRLSPDVRENTATTVLSWWERLLIGPNYVNFHLEHHMSAAVPCYRLPKLHNLLKSQGFFDRHDCLSRGYADVIRKAIKPEPAYA